MIATITNIFKSIQGYLRTLCMKNGTKCIDIKTEIPCEFYHPNIFVFYNIYGVQEKQYSYKEIAENIYKL